MFQKVSFSYSSKPLLKDVNIKIKRGERIAIIGENGSGKSTVIDLLLRFILPESGHIYIDGVDIQNINLKQYRELFAVVSQDIYLFKDTLKNNIVLGKDIEEKEISSIIRMMGMREFYEKVSQDNSMVECGGDNFSGGEKQKIALLRVAIKDSPILILDEATANIDKEYDKILHQKVLPQFLDKTIIIITHKKENLQGLDRIFEIKDKTIKEITKENIYI